MASPKRPASPAWYPKAALSEEALERLERQAKASGRQRAAYLGWVLDRHSIVIDRFPPWARALYEHCMQNTDEFLRVLAHCGPAGGLGSDVPPSRRTPSR